MDAHQEQTIRLDDHAVELGHALVVQAQVAIVFAADQRHIPREIDGRAAIEWTELGTDVQSDFSGGTGSAEARARGAVSSSISKTAPALKTICRPKKRKNRRSEGFLVTITREA